RTDEPSLTGVVRCQIRIHEVVAAVYMWSVYMWSVPSPGRQSPARSRIGTSTGSREDAVRWPRRRGQGLPSNRANHPPGIRVLATAGEAHDIAGGRDLAG